MSNYYYWLDCISRSNTERKFLDNNYYRKINNYYRIIISTHSASRVDCTCYIIIIALT